ncbi:MAG: hypothetical protein OJF59_001572 [Cytophagales bacterium]|jgi:hypothetical protein|nr:hypothetical protein [Bacteroidota bacterium]MBS1980503.1 hypothetical protein [Bacteroidota bacterium]WHZ07819.1 MAG: hypothetical protein OJF59_001572 [Cytophagales bacterium]
MHNCKKPFFIFFLSLAVGAANAQAPSPFTRFGVGDINNNGMAQNQGMGGIGISNPSPWYINNQNPALLVFNRVFVFQGGMYYDKKTAFDGVNTQSFKGGNLNYLAIATPVVNGKWSTSIGLLPYSSVNYNLSFQSNVLGSPSNVMTTVQETGKGGITQFYWSNGVAINRYLSVGIKGSYLFSSVNIKDSNPIAGLTNYGSVLTRYSFNGLNLSTGLSFHKDSLFHKKYRLNIGLTYSMRSHLIVNKKLTTEIISNTGAVIDSTTIINNLNNRLVLPQNFGVGLSFGKVDRWTVGGDFTLLDYNTYVPFQSSFILGNQYSQAPDVPTAAYRAALGGEITPRVEDFTNYLNRVSYRIGAFYEKYPFLVNGNPVFDRGGTFGFSLPVGRISTIDIGVRIGKRGVVSKNTLEENYFRIYFGATFNDQWYIKRKFD